MQGAEKNTDELLGALNGALHRLQQISIDEVVLGLEALRASGPQLSKLGMREESI